MQAAPAFNGFATLGAVYNPDDFVFVRGLEQPRGARGGWSTRTDPTPCFVESFLGLPESC